MLDRLSSFVIAITVIVMAIIISVIAGGDWVSIGILSLAGFLGAAILYAAAPAAVREPTYLSHPHQGPGHKVGSMLRHPDFALLADQESEPLIGISDNVVTIANDSAIVLLGRHIIGADIRTAIRHPAAAELLRTRDRHVSNLPPGHLVDFPRTGHRWTMHLTRLSREDAVIFLSDRSSIDAADRMRSDFVANASHELRTPLAAILGYVETLQDMSANTDPMEQRFLGIIDREARRMQQLVLDLLSVSRVEADRFRRPTDRVHLNRVLSYTINQLQNSSESRPEDLHVALGDDPLYILGDEAQLSQLVHNIITNAMKYGRAGTPIDVILHREANRAIVTIRDQGEGIAPDHLPRLTERFYRIDDARSRSVGGTGLGLAIVKHITERHQGTLTIDSRVGEGTTVIISFPLSPVADAPIQISP